MKAYPSVSRANFFTIHYVGARYLGNSGKISCARWVSQNKRPENKDTPWVLAGCDFSFALSSPATFSDLWVGQTPSSPIPPRGSLGNSAFPIATEAWQRMSSLRVHDSAQDSLVSALHLQAPHLLAYAFTCLLPSDFDNTYRTFLEGSGRFLCWSLLIFEDKQILSPSRRLPWTRGQHLRPKVTIFPTFYCQLF